MTKMTGQQFRMAMWVTERAQTAFLEKVEEQGLTPADFPEGWEEAAMVMICAAVETVLEPYEANPLLVHAEHALHTQRPMSIMRPESNAESKQRQVEDLRKQLLTLVANLKSTNKTERGWMEDSCEKGWQKALDEMENGIKEIVK